MADSPRWRKLWIGNDYNPRIKRDALNASGAYAIRELVGGRRVVRYVGESDRGVLWKTIVRHFHAQDTFEAIGERGVFRRPPSAYEVAIHVTSKGPRPRKEGKREKGRGGARPAKSARERELEAKGQAFTHEPDQIAMAKQAEWIASLRPTMNLDDGTADAEDFRAVRAQQEAAYLDDPFGLGAKQNPKAKPLVTSAKLRELAAPELSASERGALFVKMIAAVDRATDREIWKTSEREITYARHDAARAAVREARRVRDLLRAAGHDEDANALSDLLGDARPADRNPAPVPRVRGGLVELGRLTRIDLGAGGVLAWSPREAPVLVYDAAGRLHLAYRGPVVRCSSATELKEYSRTHWGAGAEGKGRECGFAPAPLRRVGAVHGLVYTTRKGDDRALTDYVHEMGEGAPLRRLVRPELLEHVCQGGCESSCAASGALALRGGSYRVTERGIVG